MIRTRGLGRALGRVMGRALGEKVIMIQMKLPGSEGPQHPHVGNRKLPMLLRMLLTWMTQPLIGIDRYF